MTTMLTGVNLEGWRIHNGPSREELFDALRLFNERRYVTFELWDGDEQFVHWGIYTIQTQINGISAEDGSSHNWNLDVYFIYGDDDMLQPKHRGPYKLYYNDVRRKGAITDATPQDKRIHVRGGEIWQGSRRLGAIPNLA
jgi:hypothetical protein